MSEMSLPWLVVAAVMLSGCATSASVIAEDPTRVDVTCRRALGDCYERAGEECPNGYTVVDRARDDSAYVVGNTVLAASGGELIVECR